MKQVEEIRKAFRPGASFFFSGVANFNTIIGRFGPSFYPLIGSFKGMRDGPKFKAMKQTDQLDMEIVWIETPDIFMDTDVSKNDLVTITTYGQIALTKEPGDKYVLEVISMLKMEFENGQLIKMIQHVNHIGGPIPTPFNTEVSRSKLLLKN